MTASLAHLARLAAAAAAHLRVERREQGVHGGRAAGGLPGLRAPRAQQAAQAPAQAVVLLRLVLLQGRSTRASGLRDTGPWAWVHVQARFCEQQLCWTQVPEHFLL